jgi:hypothetical protein
MKLSGGDDLLVSTFWRSSFLDRPYFQMWVEEEEAKALKPTRFYSYEEVKKLPLGWADAVGIFSYWGQ